MLEHFSPNEQIFVKKVVDYKEKCLKNKKVILTKFLNNREQEIVKTIIGKKDDIYVNFFSPFEEANYKRCFISPYENSDIDFSITTFKICYNKKYLKLSHKNILGNIMALQIERDVIGDIIITNENECYFCAISELDNFFKQHFNVIHQTPISLEIINDIDSIISKKNIKKKKIFVKSLRIDLIISHVYSISREHSKKFILQKYVKINYKIIENTSHLIEKCDIINVRTKGRFTIDSVSGPNKNGNFVLEISIYQ